ncbi:MAG: DUF1428 domain-containing protein [Pacificimonas sp.]
MTYIQSFVLAVPTANKDAYSKMAADAWPMFKGYGALSMQENWGVDVAKGKQTDFYRATNAKDDETIVSSWIVWPDKETCDAAAEKMQSDSSMQDMEMPFDGMRMFWGGFEPLFKSDHER